MRVEVLEQVTAASKTNPSGHLKMKRVYLHRNMVLL